MSRRRQGPRQPVNLRNPRIVAERDWLREFARWAKGDPNLSRWEADFLAHMAHYAEATDSFLDQVIPTNRQAMIVRELAERLGYETDAPVRQPSDDNECEGWPQGQGRPDAQPPASMEYC